VNHLRMIRDASREARDTRAKAVNSPRSKTAWRRRQDQLDRWKGELLELLWLHGQQGIDRAQLRQHAAEHVSAELTDLRRWITNAPARTREDLARLRENRTHNRNGPTDKPLSRARRLEFERAIAERERRVPEWKARAAHLEQLLADPHALAREWTGCARSAEARA
jgi:hypothetical protein